MTEMKDELRELRGRVDRLERLVATLEARMPTPGGASRGESGTPRVELDDVWREALGVIRDEAREQVLADHNSTQGADGAWEVHDAMLGMVIAFAERQHPEIKPPKSRADVVHALRELVIWVEMIADRDQLMGDMGWQWIGFERLARRMISTPAAAAKAVHHLEALGLIKLKRRRRPNDRERVHKGMVVGLGPPEGPYSRVEINWAKLGGHPGPRSPELRTFHLQKYAIRG